MFKKILVSLFSVLLLVVAVGYFWVLAPEPNTLGSPLEIYIYRPMLPIHPNAKNIKYENSCEVSYELNKSDYDKIKDFYDDSWIFNLLFSYEKDRSNTTYYFYRQRWNFTNRAVTLVKVNSNGRFSVKEKCTTYFPFG